MRLSGRIKPISQVKAHAAEIVRTLGDQPEPLVITQNGEAKAIMQDIRSGRAYLDSLSSWLSADGGLTMKRRKFTAAFKRRVVLEALRGDETVARATRLVAALAPLHPGTRSQSQFATISGRHGYLTLRCNLGFNQFLAHRKFLVSVAAALARSAMN